MIIKLTLAKERKSALKRALRAVEIAEEKLIRKMK